MCRVDEIMVYDWATNTQGIWRCYDDSSSSNDRTRTSIRLDHHWHVSSTYFRMSLRKFSLRNFFLKFANSRFGSQSQRPRNAESSCSNVRECSLFFAQWNVRCSDVRCSDVCMNFNVRMPANVRFFKSSIVCMFPNVRTFKYSKVPIIGCSLMFAYSKVRNLEYS